MKKMNNQGFTLIEIMIVVAIIIILAVIAVPAFNQARIKSQAASCLNNLRQIDGSYDQYYLEKGSAPAALSTLSPDYLKRVPLCPANGAYTLPAGTVEALCSVGSSVSTDYPHDLTK